MKQIRSAFAALMLAASLGGAAFAQMKPPTTMTAQQFARATVGQSVEIAVRVQSRDRTTLHAEFLEQRSDATYRATGKYVDLYFPDGTPIVMGTAGDVAAGAVLFVSGVAAKQNAADVKRVTVITNYVHVQ
jgi:hypothetical protein